MGKSITLGRFLEYSIGVRVIIELKDESAIEGRIINCDSKSLNTQLEDVVLYKRRQKNLKPLNLDHFFVKGSCIRFVHFKDEAIVTSILKRSMSKQ